TTAPSPTSASPSRSCATTARPSSSLSRDRTPTRPARSRRSTSCPRNEPFPGPRRAPDKTGREHPFGPCTLFLGRSGKPLGEPPVMVGVAQLVEHLVVVQDVA